MIKYQYIIAQWIVSAFKNDITVYHSSGEKEEYDSGRGEIDFLSVLNYLGAQGYKLIEIATLDNGGTHFRHRAFLEREVPGNENNSS